MPTTSLMPVPKQQYSGVAGLPLVGGKVYTYAAGTTNPKATYSDAAGTTEQPNPIPLNTRGEPASPIFWSGNYRVDVRDALGNLVYTVDNFNTDPAGVWGILGQLASGIGSTLMGFIQAGVGAIARTMASKAQEHVSVLDFGADPTGVQPSSDAIQRAIVAVRLKAGNTQSINGGAKTAVVHFPPGSYLMNKSVLVPMNTTLRGDGATINCWDGGPNFDTAYYKDGVLTPTANLSDADLVPGNVLSNVRFENLTFVGGDLSIRLRGAVWGSGVFNCSFYGVHIAVDARMSFYSRYDGLIIRDDNPAFNKAAALRFLSNSNRIEVSNTSIANRERGILLGEPGDANISGQFSFNNSSLEVLTYGVEFSGTVREFHAHDIYVEEVSSVFLDADGAPKYNFNIHDCYVYSAAFFVDVSGLMDSFIGKVRDWVTGQYAPQKSIVRLRAGVNGNRGTRVERSHSGELTAGDMAVRYQLSDNVMTDGWLLSRQVDGNGAPVGLDHVVLNQRYEHNISQSQFSQQIPIYDRGYYGVARGKVVGVISGTMTPVNGTEPYFLTNFPFNEYTALNYSICITPNAGSGAGGITPAPIWLKGVVIGGHATQIVPNGFVAGVYNNAGTATIQLAFGSFGANNADPAFAWMRNGQFTCEGIVKLIA